jgi:hypothetical protein
MTVRQLYYTSCEHGRDGIYGFQVNAATYGLSKVLEDAAVSASSYEPSAELLGRTPEPEPAEHPVALGYRRVGEGVVVHRSVYAGRDFTGRRGNYFAHALTLDHPQELAGLLPVDLWRSGIWAERPVDHPALPELAALPPGAGVSADEVRRLIAREPGCFAALLSAVQVALADHGRVVARTSGDENAALWVAAVTRSLPPAIALEATFTTWTSRPDEADVVLACTTPEIRVGGYAATVVNLTADVDHGRAPSTYATLLIAVWSHGQAGVVRLHELATTVQPPLVAADLDDFAAAVRILAPTAEDQLTDPDLLGALRFVAARMPGRAATATGAWQQLRDRLGRPQVDLALIARVLRDAPPSAVPAEVLSDYAAAYIRAFFDNAAPPADSWWPPLSPDRVMDVTHRFALPALLGEGRSNAVPQERIELFCQTLSADVLRAIAQLLDDRPPTHDRELVSRLPLTLSHRLSEVVFSGSHVHRLVLTARARHGDLDRVDTLRELIPALRRRREDLRALGGALWDGAVPVEDAVRLLTEFEPADLAEMDMPVAILGSLTQDAARGEIGASHARVALALRRDHWQEVPRTTEPVLEAIARGVKFSEQPDILREDDALAALRFVGGGSPLTSAAQQWLTAQVVRWTLQLPPAGHYRVVTAIAPAVDPSVLAHYTERATTLARGAGADQVARLAAVWLAIPDDRWHHLLVHQVLPVVLAKRRRDVERIAKIFARRPADLVQLLAECGGPASAWEKAWEGWRDRHERASAAQRLAAALPWGRKG